MPRERICPSCKKPVAPQARNRAFPFCSDRCKLLDLGKWFGEAYRVPAAPESPPEDDGNETPT